MRRRAPMRDGCIIGAAGLTKNQDNRAALSLQE